VFYSVLGMFLFWYANFALVLECEPVKLAFIRRIFKTSLLQEKRRARDIYKNTDCSGSGGESSASSLDLDSTSSPSPSTEQLQAEAKTKLKQSLRQAHTIFHRRVFATTVLMDLIFLMVWCLIMASFYSYREGWTMFDSVYFCFVTITTIGFGDFVPTKTRDHPLNYVFVLGGVFLMSVLMSTCTKKDDNGSGSDSSSDGGGKGKGSNASGEGGEHSKAVLQKLGLGQRSCLKAAKSRFKFFWLIIGRYDYNYNYSRR
jgi:hypothetical protein